MLIHFISLPGYINTTQESKKKILLTKSGLKNKNISKCLHLVATLNYLCYEDFSRLEPVSQVTRSAFESAFGHRNLFYLGLFPSQWF